MYFNNVIKHKIAFALYMSPKNKVHFYTILKSLFQKLKQKAVIEPIWVYSKRCFFVCSRDTQKDVVHHKSMHVDTSSGTHAKEWKAYI